MIHDLRIKEKYLKRILEGETRNIIVINDDYQRGDTIRTADTTNSDYAANHGYDILFEITHAYSGVGLENNYVCLSLVELGE